MPNRLLTRVIRVLTQQALIKFRGPAERNLVALTFDDGPQPELTPQVLRILAERGHAATFFVLGRMAEKNPEVLQQIHEADCELGNHLFTHALLDRMSYEQAQEELGRTEELIAAVTSDSPSWFRPPCGRLSLRFCLKLWRRRRRRQPVLWSVLVPHEHTLPASDALRVLERSGIRAGDIILLHDNNPMIPSLLPGLLDLLESRGLRSTTLTDLLTPGCGRRTTPLTKPTEVANETE